MTLRLSMIPIVLSLFAMLLTIPLVVLKATQSGPVANFKTQAAKDNETAISFFPSQGKYQFRPGGEIPVALILDSPVLKVGQVDLVISYNPNQVEVRSLADGILFDNYLQKRVDPGQGRVYLTASNIQPKALTGIVASFKFIPKIRGVVNFNFIKAGGTNGQVSAAYIIE